MIIATIVQISRIKLSKKISQEVVINTTKTVEVRGMKMKKVLFQLSSSQDGIVKSRKTLKGRSMRMKKNLFVDRQRGEIHILGFEVMSLHSILG